MIQGVGVGLKSQHYEYILLNRPDIPWFEVLTDNYLDNYGAPLRKLETIREHYPMVMHGVGLSIGSCDPLNQTYLKQIKTLANRIQPFWISDHICWTSNQGRYSHELLPLPFTEEAIRHIVSRIQFVQDYLQRPIVLENISSYFSFSESHMSECEFINQIIKRTGCQILLDINNVYVNSHNHGFDPQDYILSIPIGAVKQFHLAGYEKRQKLLIDTHGAPVYPEVWQLYQLALDKFGPLPTSIEWDNHVPSWEELRRESLKAENLMQAIRPVYVTN